MAVKFGIEIELGSTVTRETNLAMRRLNWTVKGDGSLRNNNGNPFYRGEGSNYDTEYITPAYEIDLNNIETAINKVCDEYKQILKTITAPMDVNNSMGIHVSVSGLKKLSIFYSRETFNRFHTAFKEFVRNGTRLEKGRLTGRTAHYCKWEYEPFLSRGDYTTSKRYRAINYTAYHKHMFKPIEFRFLPITDKPNTLKKYLKFLFKIIADIELNSDAEPITFKSEYDANTETVELTAVV